MVFSFLTSVSFCGLGDEVRPLLNNNYEKQRSIKANIIEFGTGAVAAAVFGSAGHALQQLPHPGLKIIGTILKWVAAGSVITTNAFGEAQIVRREI